VGPDPSPTECARPALLCQFSFLQEPATGASSSLLTYHYPLSRAACFSWQSRHYEAQIWAVGRLGQVAVVLSEDFNPGVVLDGVSFTNPLDPEFDLAALG
jgi:hypothetical protein